MHELTERLTGRFARQASEIYLLQGIALVAGLGGSILVARALGPEGKGTLDLFILLTTMVVQFGMLGIASGYLYELANRGRPLAQVHGDAVAVAVALGVVGLTLAVTVPAVFARLIGGLDQQLAALALGLTGVLVYAQSFWSLMTGIDRAPINYRVRAGFAILYTVGIGALWLLGAIDVATAVAVLVASWLAQTVVQFAVARHLHASAPLSPSRNGISKSLSYGLRSYPGAIANWMHYRVDQIVIAHIVGAGGVGVYAISVRWAELLWLVGYGLLNAGLFRIASEDTQQSREFSIRLFKVTLLATGAAGLALILVAGPLIGLLYGAEFAGAVVPLIILIPGVVLWDAVRVLSNHIGYRLGRPQLPAMVAIVGMALNIAATLVAVPIWGLPGAAATSTATYSLVALIIGVLFWRLPR